MNKKLLIPLFATVVGLSVVGGISGAVAWYQFNTRVNASFVGTSVADSGVLQISSEKDTGYGRDVYKTNSENNNKLTPVTFGYGDVTNGRGQALPEKAYCYPEAGEKDMEKWTEARKNFEYIQFDLYLKAQQISGNTTTDAAVNVYLSEMFLESVDSNTPEIARALRVHLAVYEDLTENAAPTRNFLISREGKTVNLHGNLDLDGNGELDREHGWYWETTDTTNIENSLSTNDLIDYGQGNSQQASWAMIPSATAEEIIAGTAAEPNYILAPRYEGESTQSLQKGDLYHKIPATEANKPDQNMICTTKVGSAVKIRVTVWIEGWALLENGQSQVSYDAVTDPSSEALDNGDYYVHVEDDPLTTDVDESGYVAASGEYDANASYFTRTETYLENAIWNPATTGNVDVKVGMQFDVGKNVFRA